MDGQKTSLSLDQAKAYIDSIDFTPIIEKMAHDRGWLKKHAIATSNLYRNYLYLKKKYGHLHKLPPSFDIDEFWHNHILDTYKYHKDCQAIFGHYLHHYPYFGMDGKSTPEELYREFEVTQKLYNQEFGDYIHIIRFSAFKPIYSLIYFSKKICNYLQPSNLLN